MKLKCIDGKVRSFVICRIHIIDGRYNEGRCEKCKESFGVHNTKILKPLFKEHVCKIKGEIR